MKSRLHIVLAVAVMMLGAGSAAAGVEESETLSRTFTLERTETGRLIAVHNVWGSVKVKGHSRDQVEMVAVKTIEADSERELERALEEVELDITEEDGFLEFYVDGPFRGDNWRGRNGRRRCDNRYRVYYEFELRVPEDADIEISAVNDGGIEVEGVAGDYVVKHVNGDIDMEGIIGSGEVYTVNGDVSLHFKSNPRADCRFGSLNGEVYMHFKPGLSADFHLETFNGEFYTDFDLHHVPSVEFAEVSSNGHTIYRAGHTTVVRAGDGGPVVNLDGFNGDMYILEKR